VVIMDLTDSSLTISSFANILSINQQSLATKLHTSSTSSGRRTFSVVQCKGFYLHSILYLHRVVHN
jgi:hypothetical protein